VLFYTKKVQEPLEKITVQKIMNFYMCKGHNRLESQANYSYVFAIAKWKRKLFSLFGCNPNKLH